MDVTRLSRTFLGLVLVVALLAPAGLQAAAPFPRGPGFYFDLIKLGVLILSFLCWVRLCAWVDTDAFELKIDRVFWNGILLAGGVAGVLLIWVVGMFWVTIILAWGMVCGPAYWYVTVRNRRAPEDERVLTQDYFLDIFNRWTTRAPKEPEEAKNAGVPIRFMSRSTTGEAEEGDRVERVQESKGYQAALKLVWDAIQRRATDIHLEPTSKDMPVRFRIDGVMTNIQPLTRPMGDAVINIFKVLCNLDITEKRKPQDGSFSAQVEDRLVEFRVATAGSVAGEKLVMRILDATAQLADLGQVGMTEDMQNQLRDQINQPHGLILVCGPTGSGKSTTLYACLHEIDRFSQNVITVENPVEYRLDGVTQIEVNPKQGKTFASELRSILRQDPDVILIGEIRDKETAEIACQAAQTGHLVFSTLHANDSITAIARMIDLGTPPFMLSSALIAVLSQRLVRKLCRKCRKRVRPSAETLKKLKVDPDAVRHIYRAFDPTDDGPKKSEADEDGEEPQMKICEGCGGTGYLKRTGIFDLLIITDRIRELIRENPNIPELRKAAAESGQQTLFEDGARLVIDGDTSIQELLRVCK
ncbi:MAG: type II/IV secretion system protein [Planctomycetes bacterium]|nr:type II/IV secretion system protein [Planctomycetota bacterium]